MDISSELEEDKKRIFKSSSTRANISQDFGNYETRLLFITQCGYIPVTASMLITTFSEPNEQFCRTLNSSGHIPFDNNEFFSLPLEFGKSCQTHSTQVTAFLSSILMWGALFGSFFCGLLSDNYGRKSVFSGCLFAISVLNLFLCFSSFLVWYSVICILFILGFASGGYMVTNFVLLTEAFELGRSRLLVVSLNGWSFSMVTTAIIAYLTKHWFSYHIVISIIAAAFSFIAKLYTYESCRWLSSTGNLNSAKQTAIKIANLNKNRMDINELKDAEWFEVLGFSQPRNSHREKKWTYLFSSDLIKPTLVMFYCFIASAIVSFGFYFSLDVLDGNRFLNLGLMGLFKFILGFSPFWLSKFFSKRIIAISSVGLCTFCALLIILIQVSHIESLYFGTSMLSLFVAAGMDPTWKINHLYSAELFPTSVRSMGRGICNAGGRFGSVLAPMVIFLRSYDSAIPNIVFGILLCIQLTAVIFLLPNEKDNNAIVMDKH